jgi:hypothetical protein
VDCRDGLVVEVVFRVVHRRALSRADEDVGAGAFLQHEGEILAAHDERRVGVAIARHLARGLGGEFGVLLSAFTVTG